MFYILVIIPPVHNLACTSFGSLSSLIKDCSLVKMFFLSGLEICKYRLQVVDFFFFNDCRLHLEWCLLV